MPEKLRSDILTARGEVFMSIGKTHHTEMKGLGTTHCYTDQASQMTMTRVTTNSLSFAYDFFFFWN